MILDIQAMVFFFSTNMIFEIIKKENIDKFFAQLVSSVKMIDRK